jgi:hypothetical protein
LGKSIRPLLVALAVLLLLTVGAAFDFVDFASLCAALARVFFLVVPVVFVVSAAVGLVARRRA